MQNEEKTPKKRTREMTRFKEKPKRHFDELHRKRKLPRKIKTERKPKKYEAEKQPHFPRLPPLEDNGLTSPDYEAFRKEKEAFYRLKPKLLADERYRGKFIAIVNQKIEAVGDNDSELSKIIDEKYGNIPAFIGKIVDKEEVIELPSPELT